ncbi:hypothetical protein O181_109787 [Austropuccinia psidii MF-1]|uniref:Pantoate--beta-alanine ligase n=1 Tax=Austropuccinia psidii MF-1 TaxID=1389203 RepID=A0A9Q3JWT1_9BASI|nr:hypothetical protein [Austropuccinia psidii MF-1]
MGGLHQGHLQLVRHSLSSQENTIVSIFLNPTQFSPSEDLASYCSTLKADLQKLSELSVIHGAFPIHHSSFNCLGAASDDLDSAETTSSPTGEHCVRKVSAVFLPSTQVLYPSSLSTDPDNPHGAPTVS